MISGETWRTALDALRANKFKAFLTMLGVVIGSACLVLVVTVGLTGKRYILAQIEGIGANLIYGYHVGVGPAQARPLGDQISLADLHAMRAMPLVTHAAATFDTQVAVTVAGKEYAVSVVGVTDDFDKVRNLDVVRGRFLDEIDIQNRAKAAVITEHMAGLLGFENPVGQKIKVAGFALTVVGVFKERVATFGQTEITSDTVIIPFPLIKDLTGEESIKTFYAQADSPDDVPLATRAIAELLQSRHRPEAVYSVQNLAAMLSAARSISNALTIVLLIVASVTLITSGIGIMNIMLVTVTERTREIGVRMAIGARRSEIEWQFLIEAFIISGVGALVGISIAVALPIGAQLILLNGLYLPISWVSVVVSLVVSCGIGILFGYLPARRASLLQPTEALHYE
ncbi:MAG: ABC transporter permease [Acidobacteriia bacterium]|nr:ABC transporter permease [Terriglobia bacterium]